MKKVLIIFVSFISLTQTSGAAIKLPAPIINATDIVIPISKTGKSINLRELSIISIKDFQQLTGKKLSLPGKIAFKLAQQKLRNSINQDGTINNKKLERAYKKGIFDAHEFHFGGFALGLFLSVIGVIIAYFINDDYKSDRTYWAWRGFLAGLVLALAIARAAGAY